MRTDSDTDSDWELEPCTSDGETSSSDPEDEIEGAQEPPPSVVDTDTADSLRPYALWSSHLARMQWEANYLAQDSAWRISHGCSIADGDALPPENSKVASARLVFFWLVVAFGFGMFVSVPAPLELIVKLSSEFTALSHQSTRSIYPNTGTNRSNPLSGPKAGRRTSVGVESSDDPKEPSAAELWRCCSAFRLMARERIMRQQEAVRDGGADKIQGEASAHSALTACESAARVARQRGPLAAQALARIGDVESLRGRHAAAIASYASAVSTADIVASAHSSASATSLKPAVMFLRRKLRWATWAQCHDFVRQQQWSAVNKSVASLLRMTMESNDGDDIIRKTAQLWHEPGTGSGVAAAPTLWKDAWTTRQRVLFAVLVPKCNAMD